VISAKNKETKKETVSLKDRKKADAQGKGRGEGEEREEERFVL